MKNAFADTSYYIARRSHCLKTERTEDWLSLLPLLAPVQRAQVPLLACPAAPMDGRALRR